MLTLKEAETASSPSARGWSDVYSELYSQVGGGKQTVAIVSKLRPLICCSSGDANLLRRGRRVIKNMDISPAIFFWVRVLLRTDGEDIGKREIQEKGVTGIGEGW